MLAIARVSKSASSRVFHPDGAAEWLLSASDSLRKAESLSIRSATASCRSSWDGHPKEIPEKLFDSFKVHVASAPHAFSTGDIDWNTKQKLQPCVNWAFNEFTCQPNSFLESALPRTFKGHVFSSSISRHINVDNAISQATSSANIFAFHATFYTDQSQ